jgi:hypothetical protein
MSVRAVRLYDGGESCAAVSHRKIGDLLSLKQ